MITLNLRDPKLKGNMEAIQEMKKLGLSDEEIQNLYDRQLEKDAKGGVDE